ncbi:MAG: hypothetical protein RMI34_06670 [Chloroherpetonaceae bacterium]|nr:hypothetical protein [Chloroherpetonaceae bacterium]MDW8019742.1 hypothetical protein [Chloroherpetonaceae bacterium]
MGLSFSVANFWLFVLALCAAVGLAIFTYYATRLSPALKAGLIVLRSLSVFLTFSLFLEPACTRTTRYTELPTLAVVIDNSESLTIQDGSGRRDSLVRATLTRYRSALDELGHIKFYQFGSAFKPTVLDSVTFSDKYTNFSDAIESLLRLRTPEKLNAAVIVSDGQVTAGETPSYAAERSPIPIYTVLVGDTLIKRDIALRRIVAPDVAVVGAKTPISAVITQEGFRGATLTATLRSDKTVLERKTITLTSPEQTVAFELVPKEAGETRFQLSLSTLAGEFSTRNNAQSFFIKVQKQKKKVLVVSGLPDPEISAVRNALATSSSIEAVFFTQRGASDFIEGALNLDKHKDADVAILIGFPNAVVSEGIAAQIKKFLETTNLPVFSIMTFQSSAVRLKAFEPFLAVRIGRTSGEVLDNLASIKATLQAAQLSIFRPIAASLDQSLRQAPPVSYLDFNFQPKPSSTTLWTLGFQNQTTDKVLFAIAKSAERKTATLTAIQFWKLWLSPDEEVRELYRQTILGTLEWLTAQEDLRRFRVEPAAKIFDESERVLFSATLQDEALQPISSAAITLKVQHKETGNAYSTVFEPSSEAGLYHAAFERLPAGDYSFSAEAREGERLLGTAAGRFLVSQTSLEFRQLHADANTLRSIAAQSGGKFYHLTEFEAFLQDLRRDAAFQPTLQQTQQSAEFANLAPTLVIILFLLAAEWLIRKLYAMP